MRNSFLILFFSIAANFTALELMAQVNPTSEGHFVSLNGASIYYEEFGEGEPLLLLHGFGRTLEDWKPFIQAYATHYRVIAWDMRGHGRSSGMDTGKVYLHMKAAKDLLALIDSLRLGKVKAIGHSSGSIVLLQAATLHPEKFETIIPVSAQTNFGSQVRNFIEQNAKPEDYYHFNEMEIQHGSERGMILSRQFYHFHLLEGDPNITTEQLKRITAQTLVVHGDNDFVPVSEGILIFEAIPNAHLWVVPNGWHMPHLGDDNGAEFLRITTGFLKDGWKSADGQQAP